MRFVLLVFVLFFLASFCFAENISDSRGFLDIQFYLRSATYSSIYVSEYGSGSSSSYSVSSLFWYPLWNGLHISESDFYSLLGLDNYAALALEHVADVQENIAINDGLAISSISLAVAGTAFFFLPFIDGDHSEDLSVGLIGMGIFYLSSVVPLFFWRDSNYYNIIGYDTALGFAREYNAGDRR